LLKQHVLSSDFNEFFFVRAGYIPISAQIKKDKKLLFQTNEMKILNCVSVSTEAQHIDVIRTLFFWEKA